MNARALVTGRHDLPPDRLAELAAESVREGLAFLSRLSEDRDRGENRFDRPGEALFAADRRNDAGRVPPDGGQADQDGRRGGAGAEKLAASPFPSRVPPFQGSRSVGLPIPRATPWADLFGPFGADPPDPVSLL
jgi:hypothetical protein